VLSPKRVEELFYLSLSLTSIHTKNSLQQTQKSFDPLKEFAILDFTIKIFVQGCTFTNQFQTEEAHPLFDYCSFPYKLEIHPLYEPNYNHLHPHLTILGFPQKHVIFFLHPMDETYQTFSSSTIYFLLLQSANFFSPLL
jgi:hypothetical protein